MSSGKQTSCRARFGRRRAWAGLHSTRKVLSTAARLRDELQKWSVCLRTLLFTASVCVPQDEEELVGPDGAPLDTEPVSGEDDDEARPRPESPLSPVGLYYRGRGGAPAAAPAPEAALAPEEPDEDGDEPEEDVPRRVLRRRGRRGGRRGGRSGARREREDPLELTGHSDIYCEACEGHESERSVPMQPRRP